MTTVAQRRTKGHRTLRLPLAPGEYEHFVRNNEFARQQLSELHRCYPELFPLGFAQGDVRYGFTDRSRKQ